MSDSSLDLSTDDLAAVGALHKPRLLVKMVTESRHQDITGEVEPTEGSVVLAVGLREQP